MMIIKSSASLRNEYPKISDLAKASNEPIFITRNGEGDTVLMSLEAYEAREQMYQLRDRVLKAEIERLNGAETMDIDDVIKASRERLSNDKD